MGKPKDDQPRAGASADRSASILGAARDAAKGRGPAPVHLWNPPFCGDLDMEIRADGSWFYNGTPIARPALVRLFASVLKCEDGKHFLVTPVEKVGIRVEDAPFIATDAEMGEGAIRFTTNLGDEVVAGPDHPITVTGSADAPRPYVTVRGQLRARIDRKTFYRLAEHAAPGPDGRLGVRSGGVFFALEP
ncbi:MAG: DUF1285 domain-containing protein [Paracoccus sp. (in: a-proteobacteria)]|nr:DUF1285 domain-containing protein [Paracoccus sp. (in: a-proteobacteria)]